MRKLFLFFISFISAFYISAQEPADALRYSWYTSSGTAREQAIGGAMGSLGGDISSAFVNPAGLGAYKTGDFILSPAFNSLNNKGTYFGHKEQVSKSAAYLGASGIVFGSGTGQPDKKRKSSAFCLALNRTADFNSNILYRGANNQSSYSQKFLEEIRNNNITDPNAVAQNFPFGTSLAFNTYWIDTIAGGTTGNYQFQTRSPIATGLLQENNISSQGGITELALAGAENYNDKFYWGFTLGIPFLHFQRQTVFTEADATTDPNNNFDYASITENLTTNGNGINAKLGVIYKPSEFFRLGFAFHSPTYFLLTDTYNASVTTNTENYQGTLIQSSDKLTGGQNAQFKYRLLTPYRLLVSGSYVVGETEDVKKQKGFVTADIEFVNYKASNFHTDPNGDNSQSTKDYLKSLNSAIKSAYKGALNFRLGGEMKFTTFLARLGASYYGNPYKNLNGENGNRFSISGGIGYRNKGMFFDVTYVYTMGKDVSFPYRLQYSPFPSATIRNTGGNIVLSVGFKI